MCIYSDTCQLLSEVLIMNDLDLVSVLCSGEQCSFSPLGGDDEGSLKTLGKQFET